jgi:predicted transposase YbfD/YdcC
LKSSVFEHFESLDDPRQVGKIKHPLLNIFTITLCATLCGADDWEAVEEYGHAQKTWLSGFLDLTNGLPSHDTFTRVFSLLNPESLRSCFIALIKDIVQSDLKDAIEAGDISVVAVDGKTLRRSANKAKGGSAIHMVNAYCTQAQLVLGQLKTDDKSNEITAVPKLLQLIELKGRLVTADAMSCQKEIVKTCVEQGADYLIAVKNNQPTLCSDIASLLGSRKPKRYKTPNIDYAETSEKSRDRHEVRRCWVINANNDRVSNYNEWQNLNVLIRIERTRVHNGKTSTEQSYYISSRNLSAAEGLNAARSHWQVESLHWMLDVGFREDENRSRVGFSAENLAVIRQLALNLVKNDPTRKRGVNNMRKRAGWDSTYLEKLLFSM